jgi:predicted DNA-binding transcriptional regulator AlpA
MHNDAINCIEEPQMPSPKKTKPSTLPEHLLDDSVLSEVQAAELIGLSTDTLLRLHQRKQGPRRVQLSTYRFGYTLRELRRWIAEQTEALPAA